MRPFSARIYKIGVNPCVDVPAEISQASGRRGYVPVLALFGQETFRAHLVPVGGGRHRLYLNQLMRNAADRETGDLIKVKLAPDTASRVLPVPADLARALRGAGATKEFQADTPSHRKEVIRWITATKNAATRQRRIELTVAHFKKPSRPVAGRRGRQTSPSTG